MKKLLQITCAVILLSSCGSEESIPDLLQNTENSMIITGIRESISYTYTSNSGRSESSVPEDVNMIQILVLDSNDDVVYEQYHYNNNAYNHYYYDSAAHGGDDYMFENTIPDTLYIPPLADGTYTVLASTTYAYSYDYYGDSIGNYPYIESYQVSDGPIFVGKATAEVTEDTDALVVMDMANVSARIDLNITSTLSSEWSLEIHLETTNGMYYSFENESLMSRGNDYYDYLYFWRDSYWNQSSYYFLPRDLKNIQLYFYDNSSGFNMNVSSSIDPQLAMSVGDVFTLNIDMDKLIEEGENVAFSWENIEWNDVGNIDIP
ncbi:hypothetical protein [Ekhidna sp.]|uniref:hypothetical protein n=1 Tax=Ekhidna sp. TaxID=2608089 RepID=UPI003CCBF4E0